MTSERFKRAYEIAATQAGHLSRAQALSVGISDELLHHYVRIGLLERIGRGVFRLAMYPTEDHEDLAASWLWSKQKGVFSHQTALSLFDLSDLLPAKKHMTVPVSWARRRIRIPRGIVVHYADLTPTEITSFGPVPVTVPMRTIIDCVASGVDERAVERAIRQATRRRLFSRRDLSSALRTATRKLPTG